MGPFFFFKIFLIEDYLCIKVHFVVQKTSEICHKFMFSLTRFVWQKSKQEKASKQEVKTHKNCMEKYLTNSVFDRLSRNLSQIQDPFPP